MKAKSMRSFAAGLIVAAGLCGLAYFSGPSGKATTQTSEKLSVAQMKSLLTSKGYVIQTEEELNEQISAAVAANVNVKEKPAEKPSANPSEKPTDKIIYRTMLTVSSGMTSIDVGKALERAHIIDSAREFSNQVEKRGLSSRLRIGTYEIESEMKIDEILSTIFK
ncbi:hypothetical protein BGM26_03820 [Bacillus sp. FJAT-29790]|uniref:hypothetical protein n=1 Tax=Bacillus sp. FJAT-29790 TaxID=1895002 RepID=UPI001C224065|nr:hypothetical protein [Bacillus sp. FJAT-29790]MBU8878120.1 hypothetical protein [Bacillus sp. FJAT-29790]